MKSLRQGSLWDRRPENLARRLDPEQMRADAEFYSGGISAIFSLVGDLASKATDFFSSLKPAPQEPALVKIPVPTSKPLAPTPEQIRDGFYRTDHAAQLAARSGQSNSHGRQ